MTAHSDQARGRPPRVSIVVGGALDGAMRQQVRQGVRPRVDVLEMEAAFGAEIYDFARLRRMAQRDARAAHALALGRCARQWSAALAWESLARVRRDDVIYATAEDVGLPLALLATRAYGPRRPRLILRLESPHYGSTAPRRAAYGLYLHYALRSVDTVLCRTTAHREYLNSVAKVPLEKVIFVPETTDPRFYDPASTDSPEARAVVPDQPYVVSAGLEMRDYPTLIEASRGLAVRVVIAAGSPWSHDRVPWRDPELLPSNVTVASYSPVQMRALYRSAAFVVVPVRPTLRACGMNVILEAWAMGKAIVASRTTGLRDYITDGADGLLCEPRDAAALRERMATLLGCPDLRRQLGARGKARVERELNVDSYVRRVREVAVAAAIGRP